MISKKSFQRQKIIYRLNKFIILGQDVNYFVKRGQINFLTLTFYSKVSAF